MKQNIKRFFLFLSFFANQIPNSKEQNNIQSIDKQSKIEMKNTTKINVIIGKTTFSASMENNVTATAFKKQLPLRLNMKELNNNEKYFNLPESLPTNASNPKTIENGDLMLFGSNTLVLFYKSFKTTYNYTKIGKIDHTELLKNELGEGNVIVSFQFK